MQTARLRSLFPLSSDAARREEGFVSHPATEEPRAADPSSAAPGRHDPGLHDPGPFESSVVARLLVGTCVAAVSMGGAAAAMPVLLQGSQGGMPPRVLVFGLFEIEKPANFTDPPATLVNDCATAS